MNGSITNAQRRVRVSRAALREFITWLAGHIPEFDPEAWAEVSLVITDDDGIAGLNERFLRHRGPTDVITFSFPPVPGAPGRRGEIYVNAERALLEARRRRIDPSRELAFYIAHGFDHLAGFDDRTPAMRARMHRRERAWIRAWAATAR